MLSHMIGVLILALAVNPLWLPILVNFILDGIIVLCNSSKFKSRLFYSQRSTELSTREKLCGLIVIPLGWILATYLHTERIGLETVFDITN